MSEVVGRRAFAQALALASLSAPALLAQEPPKAEKQPDKPTTPPKPEPDKPEVVEAPRSAADILLELVERSEQRKLEPQQRAAIHRDLERQVVRSRILSRFPLTNADEPGVHFAAFRAAEPG